MKFCSYCGQSVILRIPQGDDRERHVCDHCDTIHYQNPLIVTGTLPVHEDKVLLCKRAIEPRYGKWTLPAGFLENDETTDEGALRESWEEARAKVALRGLYTLYDVPQIRQVHMFFLGDLTDLDYSAGPESLEVALFREDEIPWDELAFLAVRKTLEHYFADRARDHFPTRTGHITKPEWQVWRQQFFNN